MIFFVLYIFLWYKNMGNVWGIIVIFKNHNLLKQDNIFTKVSFPKRDKR